MQEKTGYVNQVIDYFRKNPIIYNHCLKDCSSPECLAGVSGIERYSGRALSITKPGDIILLNSNLAEHLNWVLEHYKRVGLSVTTDIRFNDGFDIIPSLLSSGEYAISVFYYGKRMFGITQNDKLFQIVHQMNNKNNFIKKCIELGVQVPNTICFEKGQELNGELQNIKYPVYYKPAESVSGVGIECINNQSQLLSLISNSNSAFQLQEALPFGTEFYNIQYFVKNGIVTKNKVTKQVMEGCSHAGNTSIIPKSIIDLITEHFNCLVKNLIDLGMEDFFAFDVAVTKDNKIYAIECNPRVNGGTYPFLVTERLGQNDWTSKNIKTPFDSFSKFPLSNFLNLEYRPEKEYGVVIFNWGTITSNKIGVVYIGTKSQQEELESDFLHLLS